MRASPFILPCCASNTPTPIYDMHAKTADNLLICLAPVIVKTKSIPAYLPPEATAIQKSVVSKFT